MRSGLKIVLYWRRTKHEEERASQHSGFRDQETGTSHNRRQSAEGASTSADATAGCEAACDIEEIGTARVVKEKAGEIFRRLSFS
jgi:hypothetical protein